MSILFRRNKVTRFVTVDCGTKSYDWPKGMPMPRLGEMVFYDDMNGRVTDVRYAILQNVQTVRIIIEKE